MENETLKCLYLKGGVPVLLTAGEKLKILVKRRGMTFAQIADLTHQSRQNLSRKVSTNSFTESELTEIAALLNCDVECVFTLKDTGETL